MATPVRFYGVFPMLRAPTRLTAFVLTLLAAAAAGAAEQKGGSPDGGPGGDAEGGHEGGPGGPGGNSKSYSWGLGLAGISQQLPYAGIDRDNIAVPMIYFENQYLQLFGPFLDIKAPGIRWSEEQELSFTGRISFFGTNGYEASDAPILNGMAERKAGIFAGPSAKWSNPWADVSLEWLFDASGDSKGQTIKLGLERSFHSGNHFMFTPSVAAILLDKKYADYYYGVRSTEARVGRPAYIADSTMNVEFSLRTDYLINPRQAVFLSLGYTALGSEIKDSPLIDRSGETQVFMGYLYRF
jgi:outer membrane protein